MARVDDKPRYIDQTKNSILYRTLKTSDIMIQNSVSKLCKWGIETRSMMYDLDFLEAEMFLRGDLNEDSLPGINEAGEHYLLDRMISDIGKNFRSRSVEYFTNQMKGFCALLKILNPTKVSMDQNGIFDMLYYMRTTQVYSDRKRQWDKAKSVALEMLRIQSPGIKTDPVGLTGAARKLNFFRFTTPEFESCYEWEQFAKSLTFRSKSIWVKFCMLADMDVSKLENHDMYAKAKAAKPIDKYRIFRKTDSNICNKLKVYNYAGLILVFWEDHSHLIILDHSSCDRVRAYSTSYTNFIVYWNDFRKNGDSYEYPLRKPLDSALKYLNKYMDPDLGNDRDSLARHMHLTFTRYQNRLGEDFATVSCEWEKRDLELGREVVKVFPYNNEWYKLCVSLEGSLGQRVLYDFMKIYHLIPSPDINHIELHNNVVNNKESPIGHDPVFLQEFLRFCKTYLLCSYTYRERKEPKYKSVEGYDLSNRPWYKKCLKGEFIMPPRQEWGKAHIHRHFEYQHKMEFHVLESQDVTRVVREKEMYSDRTRTGELDRFESNEILHAIFKGSSFSNGMMPSEWRDHFYSDSSLGNNIAVIAGKAENTKPGGVSCHPFKTRETLSADDCTREILSEMDANLKPISKYVPGCSQRRDMQQHKERFFGIAQSLTVHPLFICAALSGDVEKWSPRMIRVVHSSVQSMFLEMTTCPDPEKASKVWESLIFITDRRGYKAEGEYKYGTVQGWHATLDTLFHCMILVHFVYDCKNKGIMSKKDAAQNLAMIDDALTKFRVAGELTVSKGKILMAKKVLYNNYEKLGLRLDLVKTFVSTIKFVYLNEAYMDGTQVFTASKVFMRMDKDHTRRLSTLPDNVETIMSIAANSSQGGCDPILSYSFAAWRCIMLALERSSLNFLDNMSIHQLASMALAPVPLNGLGIRSIVQVHTSGAMDQLAWFTEITRSAWLTPETRTAAKCMAALLCQDPQYPSAEAMANNPFSYSAASHRTSSGRITEAFLSAAKEIGLAEPFSSMAKYHRNDEVEEMWEEILTSNHYDAALLEEVSANMPFAFLDKVMKRITGAETVAALLNQKQIRVLKDVVAKTDKHNFFVAFEIMNSRFCLEDAEFQLEELVRIGSFAFTHSLRQYVMDALNYRILHHTYPCPFAIITAKKTIVPNAEEGKTTVTMTYEPSRLNRVAGTMSNNMYDSSTRMGTYRSYKSARAIVSSEKKNLIVDPIMECLCNGSSALKWAKDSGLSYVELATFFMKSWSKDATLDLLDLDFETHVGSCRRLSRRRTKLNHSMMAFPNSFAAFRVNLSALNYLLSGHKFMLNQMNLLISLKMTCVLHALMYKASDEISFMTCFRIKPNESGQIYEPHGIEAQCPTIDVSKVVPFDEWDTEFKKYAKTSFTPLKIQAIVRKFIECGIEEAHSAYCDYLAEFAEGEDKPEENENVLEDMINPPAREIEEGRRQMDIQQPEARIAIGTSLSLRRMYVAQDYKRPMRPTGLVDDAPRMKPPTPSNDTRGLNPKEKAIAVGRAYITKLISSSTMEVARSYRRIVKELHDLNSLPTNSEQMEMVNVMWNSLPTKVEDIKTALQSLKKIVNESDYRECVLQMLRTMGLSGFRIREGNEDVTQAVYSFMSQPENKICLIRVVCFEFKTMTNRTFDSFNQYNIFNMHTGPNNIAILAKRLMKSTYRLTIAKYENAEDYYYGKARDAEDPENRQHFRIEALLRTYKKEALKEVLGLFGDTPSVDALSLITRFKDLASREIYNIAEENEQEISEQMQLAMVGLDTEEIGGVVDLIRNFESMFESIKWEPLRKGIEEVHTFVLHDLAKSPVRVLMPIRIKSRASSSCSQMSDYSRTPSRQEPMPQVLREDPLAALDNMQVELEEREDRDIKDISPALVMSYLYEMHPDRMEGIAGNRSVKELFTEKTLERAVWVEFLNEMQEYLEGYFQIEIDYFDPPEWFHEGGELVQRF
nr:MAG: RNA-dependent RNA polymerase [brine shrimp qin-like virus 3]UNI73969.1 MAG: RNA-dependent RNA polymerase [brine shrimp qin-like virus 3]